MKAVRIPVPSWAPPHARHVIDIESEKAARGRTLALELEGPLLAALHERVEGFMNDPEQCFADVDDSFPQRRRLTGEYYIGSETYRDYEAPPEGSEDEYVASFFLRCLEHPWTQHQKAEGYDYLGLEAIITLRSNPLSFSIDDGFNTSSI